MTKQIEEYNELLALLNNIRPFLDGNSGDCWRGCYEKECDKIVRLLDKLNETNEKDNTMKEEYEILNTEMILRRLSDTQLCNLLHRLNRILYSLNKIKELLNLNAVYLGVYDNDCKSIVNNYDELVHWLAKLKLENEEKTYSPDDLDRCGLEKVLSSSDGDTIYLDTYDDLEETSSSEATLDSVDLIFKESPSAEEDDDLFNMNEENEKDIAAEESPRDKANKFERVSKLEDLLYSLNKIRSLLIGQGGEYLGIFENECQKIVFQMDGLACSLNDSVEFPEYETERLLLSLHKIRALLMNDGDEYLGIYGDECQKIIAKMDDMAFMLLDETD